jgi:hypothetical protein
MADEWYPGSDQGNNLILQENCPKKVSFSALETHF